MSGPEAGAGEAGCAGTHALGQDDAGQDLGMLLGEAAGQRGRRRRAGHGTGQDLDDDVVAGGLDETLADLGRQLQRADRRERDVERVATVAA